MLLFCFLAFFVSKILQVKLKDVDTLNLADNLYTKWATKKG